MANIGRPPCDEGVIHTIRTTAPCTPASGPWVLAATILGSAMAFIDGTVANVALPQIQNRLGASAVDTQTASLDLSPHARQQLETEKVDLGAAQVPEGVSGQVAADVKQAVAESFVAGFRVAMVTAAGLAMASTGASALIIEGKGSAARTEPTPA